MAVEASSRLSALLRVPGTRHGRDDPGPAGRALRSARRSRSRRGARVPQRPVGVGAVGHAGPEAVGEIAVGRRMAELDGGGDAELRRSGGRPRVRAAARARSAGGGRAAPVSRVCSKASSASRFAQVADRVHGDREAARRAPARMISTSSSRLVICDARAVEQARGLRAERAVHERLEVADAEHGRRRSRTCRCRARASALDLVGGDRLPDAQRAASPRSSSRCQRPSAPSQPSLSCTEVTPRAAASSALSHSLDLLVRRATSRCVTEAPRRLLAQHAGRLAVARRARPRRRRARGRRWRARARQS